MLVKGDEATQENKANECQNKNNRQTVEEKEPDRGQTQMAKTKQLKINGREGGKITYLIREPEKVVCGVCRYVYVGVKV